MCVNSSAGEDVFERGMVNYTLEDRRTADVIITINQDSIYEADQEVLRVRIVSVTGGAVDPERQEATVTILDDDSES